jgi:hypothetical protein
LLCAWVPNTAFSGTLAFPGRYLLAAPHELFPTTVACLFLLVVVCFPLWLLLSAANLFKLPESQKLQDSYTNPQTKTDTKRKREREVRDFEEGLIWL